MVLITNHSGVGKPEESVEEKEMVPKQNGQPSWDQNQVYGFSIQQHISLALPPFLPLTFRFKMPGDVSFCIPVVFLIVSEG